MTPGTIFSECTSYPKIFWVCLIIAGFLFGVASSQNRGLHKISNGPFLASLTNLWRLYDAYWHKSQPPLLHLHRKYGDIVRLGPNVLSFSDPQAIKDIYEGFGKTFRKSELYPITAATTRGVRTYTLFSSPDPVWHDQLRRAVSPAFTMSSLVRSEPYVDTTINVFLKEMDRRFAGKADDSGVFDFSVWLQYFAFDVVGELTYGTRHGFVESGSDVDNMIHLRSQFFDYNSLIAHVTVFDQFLKHNPVLMWLNRHGWFNAAPFPAVSFALKHQQEHMKQSVNPSQSYSKHLDREDLLDRFIRASKEHPTVVTGKEILGMTLSMILAGSESTGITMSTVFYYILKTPGCYSKLQEEVDAHFPQKGSDPLTCEIRFSEAQQQPYLHACIQEAFRIHPASAFNPERVLPPAGATICGRFVPGGTVVGCNSWAIHRNRAVFGEDTDNYRPERWLEDGEKAKEMNRTMFQFSTGKYACIGKNIALLEIYKLIPSVMRSFRISLADPDKEWSFLYTVNATVRDFYVRIERR